LADSVKFLEGQGASAPVAGEIGRERGDTSEEVLGSGTEIEDHWFLRLSAARRRWLGKGAPGSGLFRILGHKKDGRRGFRILLRAPLERLFCGVTEAFAGFLRLGGVFSVEGLVG
jgi:hypothetical protein